MVSTADSYAALQRRLDGILANTRQYTLGFSGYDSTDVASRLVQRYADLSVFEFNRVSAKVYRKTGSLPADEDTIDCAGLLIEGDKNVKLAPKKFFALLFESIAHWGYALLIILLSLRLSGAPKRVSLIYGVGVQDLTAEGSDARFLNFCFAGHLPPLASVEHLVVQAGQLIHSTDPLHVKYGRAPLFSALRWSRLGFLTWLRALAEHLCVAASFGRAVFHLPNLILLGRDAASHAAAKALNREACLQDVMLTTTDYFSQPLWVWALPKKSHTSHMVWYAQNIYPISFKDEAIAVPIPNLRFVRADIQWVWTPEFRDFLRVLCPLCTYIVVPPILWHLPSNRRGETVVGRRIAVFDVTPINSATEMKLGLLRNFYTEEIMSSFVGDVLDAAAQLSQLLGEKIEVVLKHKRKHYAGHHSSEYAETLDKLVNEGLITLVDPESNLYDLIAASDVVVSAPYSSPVYVGRDAGKDAFWYDPTETLDWKLGESGISLVQGRQRLFSRLLKALA